MTTAVRLVSLRPAASFADDDRRIAAAEPDHEAGDRRPERAGDPGEQHEEQQPGPPSPSGVKPLARRMSYISPVANRDGEQRQAEEQRPAPSRRIASQSFRGHVYAPPEGFHR